MTIEVVTYTLPVYWASYLINGDPSGLIDGEKSLIDRWLRNERPGYPVDCGDESWFAHSNDATRLAGEVTLYTFHKFPKGLQ